MVLSASIDGLLFGWNVVRAYKKCIAVSTITSIFLMFNCCYFVIALIGYLRTFISRTTG